MVGEIIIYGPSFPLNENNRAIELSDFFFLFPIHAVSRILLSGLFYPIKETESAFQNPQLSLALYRY